MARSASRKVRSVNKSRADFLVSFEQSLIVIVVLGVDGVSDFDALHSGKHNEEVQLYAFDILALAGDDLRRLPLSLRKTNLARILNQDCEAWALRHVVGGWGAVVLLQQRSGGSNPGQLQAITTL